VEKPRLSIEDYRRAANRIGCDVPAVRAVLAVEASGSGFLPDGRPKILFERHWFWKLTKGKYSIYPDICSSDPGGYSTGQTAQERTAREYDRLDKAIALDREAAIKSASWGMPQILGVNYALCGCKSVDLFLEQMRDSESAQLNLMVEFIISRDLDDELQGKNWAGFARIYNGPAYRKNRYDEKLKAAYEKYKNADPPITA
jgi:hypothetical protein